jgi:hypothetical protein
MVILLPLEQYHKFHLLLCALQGLVQISFWKIALNNKLSFTVMVLKTCQVVTCMHLTALSVYRTRLQAASTWKCWFLEFLLQRSAKIFLLLSAHRTSQKIFIKFVTGSSTKIFRNLEILMKLGQQ